MSEAKINVKGKEYIWSEADPARAGEHASLSGKIKELQNRIAELMKRQDELVKASIADLSGRPAGEEPAVKELAGGLLTKVTLGGDTFQIYKAGVFSWELQKVIDTAGEGDRVYIDTYESRDQAMAAAVTLLKIARRPLLGRIFPSDPGGAAGITQVTPDLLYVEIDGKRYRIYKVAGLPRWLLHRINDNKGFTAIGAYDDRAGAIERALLKP